MVHKFHLNFPEYRKKGLCNTEYVPMAWREGKECYGTKLTCDGENIQVNGHIIGITNQLGNKILFDCKKKECVKYIENIKVSINLYSVTKTVIPCCPSCGEEINEDMLL